MARLCIGLRRDSGLGRVVTATNSAEAFAEDRTVFPYVPIIAHESAISCLNLKSAFGFSPKRRSASERDVTVTLQRYSAPKTRPTSSPGTGFGPTDIERSVKKASHTRIQYPR